MSHFYIKQLDGTYQDVVFMYMLPTYFIFPEEVLCKGGKELNSKAKSKDPLDLLTPVP